MNTINNNIINYINKSYIYFGISLFFLIITLFTGEENLSFKIILTALLIGVIFFTLFLINFITFAKKTTIFIIFQLIIICFAVFGIIKIGALTMLLSLNIYLLLLVLTEIHYDGSCKFF